MDWYGEEQNKRNLYNHDNAHNMLNGQYEWMRAPPERPDGWKPPLLAPLQPLSTEDHAREIKIQQELDMYRKERPNIVNMEIARLAKKEQERQDLLKMVEESRRKDALSPIKFIGKEKNSTQPGGKEKNSKRSGVGPYGGTRKRKTRRKR